MMDDEDATARLLRLAGPRPLAPAERASRVRAAVHQQWREVMRRRIVRRRAAAGLAALAAAGVAAAFFVPRSDVALPPTEILARVERVEGSLPLAGAVLREGEWVETTAATRAALRLTDGTSVRLDASSRMRLLSPVAIELAQGGLYIDTKRESAGLEVRTAVGTARDIGTQFETRLTDGALRVRVRTGVVELRPRGGDAVTARAGTELTLRDNEVARRSVSRDGREWDWAAALAPGFDIEGRSVAAFLEHVSREHGWSLRYADAALARDASSIILHGSVAGLAPEDALGAALATSSLVHRVTDGELVVSRRAEEER
jgi:ferric-dicitrate binding protein FerR (iron transport regulator)